MDTSKETEQNSVGTSNLSMYSKYFKLPLLTQEEELVLFKRFKEEHDESARTEIYEHNIRLAVSFALKYKNSCKDLNDLVQDAIVGIGEAINVFDYTRGLKFSTFAWYSVLKHIQEQYHFQNVQDTSSMNATIDEDGTEVGELIADDRVAPAYAKTNEENVSNVLVDAMLSALTPYEIAVVSMHIGLAPQFSKMEIK